jgi:hypothetical protein
MFRTIRFTHSIISAKHFSINLPRYYSKQYRTNFDDLDKAYQDFQTYKMNDPFAYENFINELARNDRFTEAKQILKLYAKHHQDLDPRIVSHLTHDYLDKGRLEDAIQFLDTVEDEFNLKATDYAHSGIVAILCNRNQIPDAIKYIKSLPTDLQGPVVYEMLIRKWCGKNKEEAIKFAESLPKEIQPDMDKLRKHGHVFYHGISCECC